MNTLILYAMGLASLAVIIAGAFFLVIMMCTTPKWYGQKFLHVQKIRWNI